MFDNIGSSELLIVVFIAFLFFGPKKIPDIARTFGKGLREFRNAMNGIKDDIDKATKIT